VCCFVWMNVARTAGATCAHFRCECSILAHACPYSRDSDLRGSSSSCYEERTDEHFRRARTQLLKIVLLLLLPHTTAWQILSACTVPESICVLLGSQTNIHTHTHTYTLTHTYTRTQTFTHTHTHSCDCHPTITIFPSTSLVRMSRAIAVHVHTARIIDLGRSRRWSKRRRELDAIPLTSRDGGKRDCTHHQSGHEGHRQGRTCRRHPESHPSQHFTQHISSPNFLGFRVLNPKNHPKECAPQPRGALQQN